MTVVARRRRAVPPLVFGLAMALSMSSCSFAFVKGPSDAREPDAEVECTSSFLVPLLDVVFVAAGLSAAAAERPEGIGAQDVVSGVPWLVSALYGSIQASRCREAREEAEVDSEPAVM